MWHWIKTSRDVHLHRHSSGILLHVYSLPAFIWRCVSHIIFYLQAYPDHRAAAGALRVPKNLHYQFDNRPRCKG